MADFSDVVVFAQTHGSCGGVTPAVSPSAAGGYLLTLTCACGATLQRRVNADEAAQAPFANGTASAPRRPDRPRVTPSPDLERAMQEALEAEEAATTTVTSTPRRETPRIAPRPDRDAVRAPSVELEDALRQAVAASDSEAPPARPVPPKPAAVPRMSNVQGTVRAALREQERLRADVGAAPAPARPKSRAIWVVVAVLLVLAAVTIFFYVASELELEAPTLTRAYPQNSPVTFPAASTSMPSAPGTFGSPGIVNTSPA